MSVHDLPQAEVRIELGEPVLASGAKRREILVAAALGAPVGTRDPVDLALLGAASRKEDLRHYQQLSFTPLDPLWPCSTAKVRRVDDGEEWLLARGELEAILQLCHPDEATRYHAELQAEIKMLRGFLPLAVAQGISGAQGVEWRFLGYLPVRATRQKKRRREEPGEFRWVHVWDWQLRSMHWLAVFLILLMAATGFLMGSGRLAGGVVFSAYLSHLRLIHFIAGWLFLCSAIIRVAGLFLASNRFQRYDALFPVRRRDLKNLLQVAQNYLFCRFDRGPHYIGHNPLQQVAYTAIYAVGIAALGTGFALYALYAPDHWLFGNLIWIGDLVGVQNLRLIHILIMWVFLAFIPIHVYLSIRADTVEREGAISSIISGGRWCRKGTRFEDGASLPQ